MMNTIQVNVRNKIAILTLDRSRSNPINTEMVEELRDIINNIDQDENTLGLIITGKEGFFSAGVDLIELYNYDEDQLRSFWTNFLAFVAVFAAFKKPAIAAINGHSPAGGCVLALCCDYRIMADGKYVIGLNELPVGIIVPNSIFQLYAFWLGKAKAYRFLLEGKLLSPAEALSNDLIDEIAKPESILTAAERQMQKFIQFNKITWQQSKLNLRQELLEHLNADESQMLETILKQWWSPSSRAVLKTIIGNLQNKQPG
jgi:3,2-trans-enoyl-CoA isomerase